VRLSLTHASVVSTLTIVHSENVIDADGSSDDEEPAFGYLHGDVRVCAECAECAECACVCTECACF